MSILLFITNCFLAICVVFLFLVVRDHEHTIVELESLLQDVNDSLGTYTTIVRNHSDVLSELREDIKILNNEVF